MPINDIPLKAGTTEITIPQLGFGVWQVPDDEVDAAVLAALETGYRHIDTAKIYGNEAGVGRALAQTDVPRDEIFVTTKLWPTDYGTQESVDAFNASMDRLGIETLDLYLLHWPFPEQDRYVDAWKALQALRDAGRIKAIGVCNFHVEHLQLLFDETGEWPAINQIEIHPYLQQRETVEFNAEQGIVTQAWSPLASGKEVLDDAVIGGIAENFAATEVSLTEDDMAAIADLDRGMRTGPNPDEFNG